MDETRRRGLDRRALLMGGLVAGGGWATLAGAAPAPAATSSAGAVVYGPAPSPSGTGDTAALGAALLELERAGGGTMMLPAGTYHLEAMLYVRPKIDLVGAGGGWAGHATVLQCLAAESGITVWGGGGVTGNFAVDGAGVALAPFTRAPQVAAGRTFSALTVSNSAQDGVTCLGAQNDAWYLLTVDTSARDGLVLDQGYGGSLFSKCEIAHAGRHHVRFDDAVGVPLADGSSTRAPTTNNLFHQCLFEYSTAANSAVAWIRHAWSAKFDHCGFFASTTPVGPLIDVLGASTEVAFADCYFQSGATAAVGLRVDYGSGVALAGTSHFQGFGTAIHLQRSPGAPSAPPWVDIQGLPLFYDCANRFGADPGVLPPGQGPEFYVNRLQRHLIQARPTADADAIFASRVHDALHYSAVETGDGTHRWGDGTAEPDVTLRRRAAGVLGVEASQLFATGFGPADSRPAAVAAAAGALRLNTESHQLEVSDGARWYAPAEHAATFTGTTTFVVPPGVTALRCRALGAGGGGGGGGTIGKAGKATSCHGGAGGGAGMLLEDVLRVTPGDTLTITVGAGGAGGRGGTATTASTGHAGTAGAAGGSTAVRTAAGAVLIQAPGGGGGTAGPAATATAAVAPTSGGAYGCADVARVVAPGCGSFGGAGTVPAPGGVCGGASGGTASTTRGGGAGTAPSSPGQRATSGTATSTSVNGLAGARPTAPGCGGNGGGGGSRGGAGGPGGAGSAGRVDLSWVV
jgi:hypothetical protein